MDGWKQSIEYQFKAAARAPEFNDKTFPLILGPKLSPGVCTKYRNHYHYHTTWYIHRSVIEARSTQVESWNFGLHTEGIMNL